MESRNSLRAIVVLIVITMTMIPLAAGLFENDVVVQPGSGSGNGAPGAPGAPGQNASCNGNISVNSTVTLSPGTPAYVVSAWNGTWAAMDFGIPAGSAGAAGANGADGAKGDKGDPGDPGTVDTSGFLFLNGTRAMSGNLSMASHWVIGVLSPISDTDAANKQYVDSVNTSMKGYVDALNASMALNTKAYTDTVNISQSLNVSLNHASKVAGKVPTSELGSGVADATTYLRGDQSWQTVSGSGNGYTLTFQALTSTPARNTTIYIGGMPKVPSAAGQQKVFIPKTGTIKAAYIYTYSGTAGTAETWGMDIQVNATSKFVFPNLTLSTNERTWSNISMSTPVTAGNYLEVQSKQPNWVTAPATTIYSGVVYIE
jgi:hypothetical protein